MAKPLLQLSYTLPEIAGAAQQFWAVAVAFPVWAIEGDMGAGKTTFIHAVCEALGVEDAVSSPTFAIINEYHFSRSGRDTTLYHMDWYRLRDEAEARAAGVEDCLLQRGAYNAVEWPSNAPGLLRGLSCLKVQLRVLPDGGRELVLEPAIGPGER